MMDLHGSIGADKLSRGLRCILLLCLLALFLLTVFAGCDRGPEKEAQDDLNTNPQTIVEGHANRRATEKAPHVSMGSLDDDSAVGTANLENARQLIANGQFDGARYVIGLYLKQHPRDPVALEMEGDGAIQEGNFARANTSYEAAANAAITPSKGLWFKFAGALIGSERPFDAIEVLRKALVDHPDDLKIRQNLASLLARVGLQDEAAEHLQWLVQRKHGSHSILLQLSDLTFPQTHNPTCESALLRNPSDLRPIFSLALHNIAESNWDAVEKSLAPVVAEHPSFLPAVALYGRALVELGNQDAIQEWSQALPEGIEAYSQYWMAAGNWAYRNGAMKQAARAYWSAVQLNENDAEALHGLSVSLTKLGKVDQSKFASHRAAKVAALRSHTATLSTWNNNSQKTVVDLALTLKELGRPWEATNWLMLGHSMRQHRDPRFDQTFRSIRDGLTGATPWQQPEHLVSKKVDLSSFPKIVWVQSDQVPSTIARKKSNTVISFRDEAAIRSLRHVCAISAVAPQTDPESSLMIYQSGAGGAGVIDLDLDGWPDTYLTVMNGTPGREDSQPNRLYRNLSGEFSDITENSRLVDRGYAQGISVGDYNADGWPDVFVANIGENRLYRNNGDGTFRDVTAECEIDTAGWTTSVAIADLDSDGHADIYEVGYCRGKKPLVHECVVPSIGKVKSCNPMAFDPEPDRIWKGNGDGTFSKATDWFGPHNQGRGFALVIGDLDCNGGLETYVANDMTGNHYWGAAADGSECALAEQATIRGLAFNRRSIAQASMGIAAADADNDGDIDFFLTHFVDDYNTYYQQHTTGFWADESKAAGFVESSKPMLAYGTQWIDADNDGELEIFVANGDIDDFEFEGRSFRQPAQLLKQVAGARWQVVQADQAGEYFATNRLARAVATLDANRDGRSDVLVTHLFDPVSLLINYSRTSYKQMRFFLRARSTHRDAIGARVRLSVGDRTFQRQLLAGNGFQCVNEQCIVFGGFDADQLSDVHVTWPDGDTESLGRLTASGDYFVVEGQGATRLSP